MLLMQPERFGKVFPLDPFTPHIPRDCRSG
jgi:hypothetical protein